MQNHCPNCGWFGTTSLDELTITCPLCKAEEVTLKSLDQQGRECWEALHAMENPTEADFAAWVETIPEYGCLCVEHFNYFCSENPPDFDNFKEWAVKLHNHVNRVLGKPQWGSSTVEPVPNSQSVASEDATTSPAPAIATSTEPTSTPDPVESLTESESDSTTPELGEQSEPVN